MPPKDKKSKRERLRREEEERKAREEEEARLQAEERERKEREKREAAERLIRENEECKMRKVQLGELDEIYAQYEAELDAELEEKRRQNKWARYMKCDGSPDPTILPDINMYMSLWHEDTEHTDFETILKESELVLKLIEELDSAVSDMSNAELTPEKQTQYKNTMGELEILLQEKLDIGSHDTMSKASVLANPETNNLEYTAGNENITLCLWGNLSKNPRIKSFEFIKRGLFFELPRVLTLTDCVVRALFTRFDHFSPQSTSYLPQVKRKTPEVVEPGTETVVDVNLIDGDEEEEEEEQVPDEPVEGLDEEKSEEDLMAILQQLSGEKIDKKEEVEEEIASEESSRHFVIESDYEIKTPEPVEYEDFDGDEDAVDLRAYHIVGDILNFNLLHMPPQPKVIKNWTITQLIEPPELQHLSYTVDQPKTETVHEGQTDDKNEASADTKSIAKPEYVKHESKAEITKEKKEVERPPILLTLKMPEDVYFCEEPQIVRWDSEEKMWRTDGFLDKLYNESARLLTFRTCQFAPLALMQDAHVNMPFQSWELRPRAANHAQLTIIAAVVEVEIQIKDSLVCLSQPDKRPEVAHLINQWMTVHEFIKKMRAAGVNVFPAEDSYKYVKIPDKNAAAEFRLYQQMALVASSMAFSWSKWNVDNDNKEQITVQAAEHTTDEMLLEDDWWLLMVTKKRCARLKMSEFDETFSDELENTEYYADLYHMMMATASATGTELFNSTEKNFMSTVNQLLCATRLITFA